MEGLGAGRPRPLGSQPHLELLAIGKRFGGVQALRSISLAVPRGEIHGIVGENGAGKSTLGKIVAGAIQPDEGAVIVAGRSVRYRSPRQALDDGVTLISQERVLVQTRSVIENVFLGVERGRGGVVSRRRLAARYDALRERTGFDLPADARVGDLRAADQGRVEVLRALAREADLVVMDEPTAGLTRAEAAQMLDVVRLLKAHGVTVIYVSHELEEVLSVAGAVSVLRDGDLVLTAPASGETVVSLVTAMLGRALELTFPEKVFPPVDAPVVLSARGLRRVGVVDDVSFDVRAGEVVGLTGLAGSGRTQVARLVFAADRMSCGSISLDGRPLRIRSPREAIRRGIALLPESRVDDGLMMRRSITENVALPHLGAVSRAGVLRRSYGARRAAELIERFDVRAHAASATPQTLSGGNQQKVLFAKWMFSPPRVLVLDEPTRGVDVGARRALYEFVHSYAAAGMAVLLVSSEIKEVLGLAHRVLVMRGGRLVAELDGRTCVEDDVVRAAFGAGRSVGRTA